MVSGIHNNLPYLFKARIMLEVILVKKQQSRQQNILGAMFF